MIPSSGVGVPAPGRIPGDLPPCGESVGTGFLCIEVERVIPAAGMRHGVGGEIVVISDRGGVAVRWFDAILDAIAIRVELRAVPAVQVGENFDGGDVRLTGSKGDGERPGVTGGFIHEEMGGGVVAVDAVHREDRFAEDAVREGEHLISHARLVVCGFFFVVVAVPETDLVSHGAADRNVLEQRGHSGRPPHRRARHALATAVVAFGMREGEGRDLGISSSRAQGTAGCGSVGGVVKRALVRPLRGWIDRVADVSHLRPKLHVVTADHPVVRMKDPCGAVADGEWSCGRSGVAAGDLGAALVSAAVDERVVGRAGIEGKEDIVLKNFVRRDVCQIDVGIPKLIVAGIGME